MAFLFDCRNIFYLNLRLKPEYTVLRAGRRGARRAAGRGETEQNRMPTTRVTRKLAISLARPSIVGNCSELPFASTNTGNPMLTVRGSKLAVDPRFMCDFSAVYSRDRERSFVPGCRPIYRHPFVFYIIFMQGISGNGVMIC